MRRAAWLVVLAACSRGLPPAATAGDAQRAHVELADLEHGRQLLVSKCGGACHRPPLPTDHAASEWPAKLDEMGARAGIDRTQRALIERYLVTMTDR